MWNFIKGVGGEAENILGFLRRSPLACGLLLIAGACIDRMLFLKAKFDEEEKRKKKPTSDPFPTTQLLFATSVVTILMFIGMFLLISLLGYITSDNVTASARRVIEFGGTQFSVAHTHTYTPTRQETGL